MKKKRNSTQNALSSNFWSRQTWDKNERHGHYKKAQRHIIGFLCSQTLQLSFKAVAFPWTLFYRNPLSREEKTDLSAPSIKFPTVLCILLLIYSR